MTPYEGRAPSGPTLHDAEALVRSLVGVAAVRMVASADGSLHQIIVVPDASTNDRQICRNVTSALMARFGVDLDPDAISISPAGADTHTGTIPDAAAPANGNGATTKMKPARNGGARVDAQTAASRDPEPGRSASALHGATTNGGKTAAAANGSAANRVVEHTGTQQAIVARGPIHMHAPVRPRLEVVELRHVDGLARCRVVVVAGSERFVGVADGLECDVNDIDLAGRVTVDALRAARTPAVPVQFEGASIVDVAGRAHVVVGLSVWTGADFESVAGAEPVRSTTFEAAAQAVISSITARLIT